MSIFSLFGDTNPYPQNAGYNDWYDNLVLQNLGVAANQPTAAGQTIAQQAAQQAGQAQQNATNEARLKDYLDVMNAIAMLAAAMRKPPKQKRQLPSGGVGVMGGRGGTSARNPVEYLLRR